MLEQVTDSASVCISVCVCVQNETTLLQAKNNRIKCPVRASKPLNATCFSDYIPHPFLSSFLKFKQMSKLLFLARLI